MKHSDCQPLIEKITARIQSWTAKFLSFAGRLQLIDSVLNSMVHYWMFVFVLPKRVIKAVESICSIYLWNGGLEHTHAAKVSWKHVCMPRTEGGLGSKDLSIWNLTSIARQIWLLFRNSWSLWKAWVQSILLKAKTFWLVKPSASSSWNQKKLLQLRSVIKPLIKFNVGTGDRIIF